MAQSVYVSKMLVNVVAYGAIFLFAAIWICMGVVSGIEGSESRSWPCVSGKIESAGLGYVYADHRGRFSGYKFSIKYSFQVESHQYTGERISTDDMFFGDIFTMGSTLADKLKKTYKRGELVQVCYNPDSPENAAVLETGISHGSIARMAMGLIALVFGVTMAIFDHRNSKRKNNSQKIVGN